MVKALIFDSSSIISLTLNDLLFILKPLKEIYKGEFFITSQIKRELITIPSNIKRFELEVLMIKKLIEEGIIKVYNSDINELNKEVQSIMKIVNNTFKAKGEFIKIIHEGETSIIALRRILNKKNYEVNIIVDERVTRFICENSSNLQEILEHKLHTPIKKIKNVLTEEKCTVLRSSELALIALEKGIINLPGNKKEVADALLYGLKYQGCAITREDIEKAKKMF